jgi:hypothetical protein
MNPNTAKNLIVRNAFLCAAAIAITSCGTATFTKTGSDAQIESLRNFELALIDEFAVPGKRFNAAAFDAKVNEGNAKFQQAIADEKFTARRPVLVDLSKGNSTLMQRICEAKPAAEKSLRRWQAR